jgi:hypothetical protein
LGFVLGRASRDNRRRGNKRCKAASGRRATLFTRSTLFLSPFQFSFPACDNVCQTNRIAAGLTMKQMFQDDIKLLKLFDKQMRQLTTNEACRISQCLLKCYRTKLNLRCEGAAGSILALRFKQAILITTSMSRKV